MSEHRQWIAVQHTQSGAHPCGERLREEQVS